MRRRHFIALIGGLRLLRRGAAAQTPPRVYRVGFLAPPFRLQTIAGQVPRFARAWRSAGTGSGKTSHREARRAGS